MGAQIAPTAELVTLAYREALWVASREEIIERTGERELSERELAERAQSVDATVGNVGG